MRITAFDIEFDPGAKQITQYGYWTNDGSRDRSSSPVSLIEALDASDVIVGHNILQHDLPVLQRSIGYSPKCTYTLDTLYLSSILFAERPYHKLTKPYIAHSKIDRRPSPTLDSKETLDILLPELQMKWSESRSDLKSLLYHLLRDLPGFSGWFKIIDYSPEHSIEGAIRLLLEGSGCRKKNVARLIQEHPIELCAALSIINAEDRSSILPTWLNYSHPKIVSITRQLTYQPCSDDTCSYCSTSFSSINALNRFFNYPSYRKFNPEEQVPLQQQIVERAIAGSSLTAVLPTGGGKSLCYQVPALLAHELKGSLTIVISPLQSLMKDQVDNLKNKSITSAYTINGLVDKITRQHAMEAVEDGRASMLYISPESLRSRSMFRLITRRDIDRIVIDEAHCFSNWGHDFRTDYMYIAQFIKRVQNALPWSPQIPISCFTATAKPQVIRDISQYFLDRLSIDLEVITTSVGRINLSYSVTEAVKEEKFEKLLNVLDGCKGPTIVYSSRVKTCEALAEKLNRYGKNALVYHGKLAAEVKTNNQELFMEDNSEYDIMVATSAFGMGVDKDDITDVVHYEISSSLENYVQEAGRAGRKPEISAHCHVLYDEEDLQKHFMLLNSTKLNKKDIDQIWRALKRYKRKKFSKSALEIADSAGWDTNLRDLQTRVKTALAALEEEGFVEREENATRIFAQSILVKNFEEARSVIVAKLGDQKGSTLNDPIRIMQSLISRETTQTDLIAMQLGLEKELVGKWINKFKDWGLVGDSVDLSGKVNIAKSKNHASNRFEFTCQIEDLILLYFENLGRSTHNISLRHLHMDIGLDEPSPRSFSVLKKILESWESSRLIRLERSEHGHQSFRLRFSKDLDTCLTKLRARQFLAKEILKVLLDKYTGSDRDEAQLASVRFNISKLRQDVNSLNSKDWSTNAIEGAIFHLIQTATLEIDGGLMIYYSPMKITRLADTGRRYTYKDHERLEQFYKHKTEQIHIVGEYARKMLTSHILALQFVDDYFKQEYPDFLSKYFHRKTKAIQRPISPSKFREITEALSEEQTAIITDNKSSRILVGAGPGSGKTRVLVHKVASIMLAEDVKPEQFLMLSFSRQAANEMRVRLKRLIGSTYGVDINTFHSYAFELIGRTGDLEHAKDVIQNATNSIIDEPDLFPHVAMKQMIVVDEFQDIDQQQFEFLQAIIQLSTDARVIVVGDDDQNIYEFRGSSVKFMRQFAANETCKSYFLTKNYRSYHNLVDFSNLFLNIIPGDRLKKGQQLLAHDQREGRLEIHSYPSNTKPWRHLLTSVKSADRTKTTAILTRTNDQALQVAAILADNAIPSKLILDRQGYSVHNIIELEYFTYQLKNRAKDGTGFVSDNDWSELVDNLKHTFSESTVLAEAVGCIELFAKAYDYKSYADWIDYLYNLKHEDLAPTDLKLVWISTMHKAKGKEWDTVILYLDKTRLAEESDYRLLYVAITRAKQNLLIHTNTPEFLEPGKKFGTIVPHEADQSRMKRIYLLFGLRHVYLGSVKPRRVQESLHRMYAGNSVVISNDLRTVALLNGTSVILSHHAQEQLASKLREGYYILETTIDRIVVWTDRDDKDMTRYRVPVLLLQLGLRS